MRTVEGEIRDGLVRRGLAPKGARIEVASRTDRGVSARANALSLASSLGSTALLRALNGIAPEIFFTAAAAIPDTFRVRAAVRRTYRYFEPARGVDVGRRNAAAACLSGTIDVRSFGRGVPAGAPCLRKVESVIVAENDRTVVTEVRAPSFVWGMVRKIVSALREYDAGRLSLTRLEAAVRGRERLTLPLAEPEGLVLWEVEYPLAWERAWAGPNRRQASWSRSAREGVGVRAEVLQALPTDAEPGRRGD